MPSDPGVLVIFGVIVFVIFVVSRPSASKKRVRTVGDLLEALDRGQVRLSAGGCEVLGHAVRTIVGCKGGITRETDLESARDAIVSALNEQGHQPEDPLASFAMAFLSTRGNPTEEALTFIQQNGWSPAETDPDRKLISEG